MPDLTTAEMRDIQVELVELLSVQNKPMKRWSPLLDILDEALARREREEIRSQPFTPQNFMAKLEAMDLDERLDFIRRFNAYTPPSAKKVPRG